MMKFTFQQDRVESGPFKAKLTYMGSKDVPKAFRICPAFAPADESGRVNPLGWVPFVDETETATTWLAPYREWSNIGHGAWGRNGNRKNFLRFCELVPGYDGFDPIEIVRDFVRDNHEEWGYLLEKRPVAGGREDSVLRWYPDDLLLCNVVVYSTSGMPKTTLGSFSQSLRKQLIGGPSKNNTEDGIVNKPSGLPPEMIAQDPMRKFWLGDITNPQTGAVLEIYRDEGNGGVARYKIRPAVLENSQGIMQRPLTEQQMAERINLANPANFLNFPTDPEGIKEHQQAEVDRLCSCLNQWRPDHKLHEFDLLRYLFGPRGFDIPQPPPIGSVNGFTPPEAIKQEQPAEPQPAQQPAQQPAPQPAMQTPTYPADPQPIQAPNAFNTAPTAQPGFQHYPAQPMQQPAYQPQPYQQQFPQIQYAGQPYAGQPAAAPAQPAFVPAAPAVEQPPAQPQAQPAFIPGAPVPPPAKDSFISRLMAKNNAAAPQNPQ